MTMTTTANKSMQLSSNVVLGKPYTRPDFMRDLTKVSQPEGKQGRAKS